MALSTGAHPKRKAKKALDPDSDSNRAMAKYRLYSTFLLLFVYHQINEMKITNKHFEIDYISP